MATVRLHKANNFRANVTVSAGVTTIGFLVAGSTADCLVYMPPGGALLGQKKGITAGNVTSIGGVVAGNLIQAQINPSDSKLGNATVTY